MESVLNQTYKNLEIIMCDDGSKDNTVMVIEEYLKKDRRCILLKNEKNKGMAYSLNRCLKVASEEYIGRHDTD